ncbi:unnamed protein product [Caenorhabditis auriculariae]|uniref:Uncharacterized protein n=1 Tax=Caenorhabditis auriculariae TaxID=2777116 RepID=A0A8S1HI43_9PELO|nr:unnamed protein product [Caenorhabditis auriculariae]
MEKDALGPSAGDHSPFVSVVNLTLGRESLLTTTTGGRRRRNNPSRRRKKKFKNAPLARKSVESRATMCKAQIFVVLGLLAIASSVQGAVRRDTAVAVPNVALNFRDNCYIKESGGCKCVVNEGHDEVTTREYDDIDFCKKPVELQTAENKKALNKEILKKYGDFKENCFAKPSGGCKCNVDLGQGEVVQEFSADEDCKKSVELVTAEHKKELNEEIKEKFGDFKENCYPKPSGGCKCNEKDGSGNEVVTAYNNVEQCRVSRDKRDVAVQQQRQPQVVGRVTKDQSPSRTQPNYDVRDPVREKAQANYAAVLEELKTKFKGLKEGCFPRPKGCLCVIGKTPDGRDITERRMKDSDCKCQEGERSRGCPAA